MSNPPLDSETASMTFPVTAGDLNIYHARSIADQQITYVLEFASHLELERLQAGLAALYDRLPILSCVVQVQGTRYRRVRMAAQQPCLSVLDEPDTPQDEILRFVGTPCDPENQLPLQVLLIRAAGRQMLCFKSDHVLTDAAGLKYLLYCLAEAYSNGRVSLPINPERGFRQVFKKFSPITLLNALRKANLPVPGQALLAGPFDKQPIFIEDACLEPEAFERAHKFTKGMQATLNDLLLTALYRTIFERLGSGASSPYPVMVPVDMRRYLANEKGGIVGNLSSAIYPQLARKPGESFAETLARVKGCMDALKQDQPGLGAALLMNIGALRGGRMLRERYQKAASRGSRFINFTNFGVIDKNLCNFGGLFPEQAYGVGPIQYAPGILIALSTYRNNLHWVVQGNDAEQFQPFIRKFLADTLSNLRF
jgi:NRPS condensation-like uncharacterized protein